MKNELSLKIYKIDWKKIIDNSVDKNYWDKKWTVFEYNKLFVEVELERINVKDKNVTFKIYCKYKNKSYSSSYNDVSMLLEKKFVDEKMNSYILKSIEELEKYFIYDTDMYEEAREIENNQEDILTRIAENYLDNNGISLSDVRDAYISVYVDDNIKNYTSSVVSSLSYKILTKQLLTFCKIAKKDEKYKEIINKSEYSQSKINKLRKEITLFLKEIDTDDYVNEMEGNINDL